IRLPLSALRSSTERQSAGVCRPGAEVSGSARSTATTTLRMSARSGTERAITPPKSVRYVSGMTPVPLSRPLVPRSVTRLPALGGGLRGGARPALPFAPAAGLPASPPGGPPLDAIDDFDGLNTFHTCPHASFE